MDRITVSRRLAVDPQQCQVAIAAADHGSIRQAAELRSVQHSILNRSIRRFEHRIRVTVFIAQRLGCDTADCFD
ncbi:helix-turn-helix domain-containing protein [Bradyrhizobium sp. USDA 4469]